MAIQTWGSFEGQDSNRIPVMAALFCCSRPRSACHAVAVRRRSGVRATHGDPAAAGPWLQIFRDDAEETVRFVGDSSSKINAGAERKKIPQTIKLNWVAI